jgi:Mrp family chromosome partitioning ATPase
MNELPIHYAELESIYSQTIDCGVRSLAITACNSGEGTTTLACALAKRAQAGGRKTLLVDMNFCHPSIGPELGLEPGSWKHLDNLLVEQISLVADSNTPVAYLPKAASSLSVLPAPSTPTGNLMLREKDYLARCMEAWLKEYELVIVDTSPLNAINRHNLPAERICSQCEGTVLTVLAGITKQAQLQSAMERLNGHGIQLSGCVFNDRFCPTLAEELIRETQRFQRWLPSLMSGLRTKLRESTLFNISI